MRKVLALLAIVAMVAMVGGCAFMHNMVKGMKNVTGTVDKVLCSPTVDNVTDAVAALTVFRAFEDAASAYGKAIGVFNAISLGICVSIPQLQAALDAFDAFVTTVQGQVKMKGIEGGVRIPALNSLRIAAHK